MRRRVLLLLFAIVCVVTVGMPAVAVGQVTTYRATLEPINGSGASGSLTLELDGNQATITERVSGLAETFQDGPYPHVQHIHGGAEGVCPDMSADEDGDGVISTAEGVPSYGEVLTTLSTEGDTSPEAATNVEIAPSGGSFTYSRTIELSDETVQALQDGNAVVVVHGLDPATLPEEAQDKMSELAPSLPLAATSPALCGPLMEMPADGVAAGGGSTAGMENGTLYALGIALLGAAAALMTLRRRAFRRG